MSHIFASAVHWQKKKLDDLVAWCSDHRAAEMKKWKKRKKKAAVIPTLILYSLTSAHHLLSDLQIPSWRGGPCPWRDSRTYGGVGAWGSAHHPHPAPRYPSITGHLPQPAPQAWRPHERAHDWAVGLQRWPSKGAELDVKRNRQLYRPTVRSTSAIWTYQQTACRPTFHTFSFCMRPRRLTWGQWVLSHTSCHTKMELTVMRWRSRNPSSPVFVSLIKVRFFFFSSFFWVYFRENPPDVWDITTSRMWIWPFSDFKERASRDSDFIHDPSTLNCPHFLTVLRISTQTCLTLFCFFPLSVYPILCVSLASEYLFFCPSVCENEWI